MTTQAISPKLGKPVIAYLKPTDYCNVGCDHCYLPKAVRANKFRMDDETFTASLNTVADMVKAQRAPGALIVWHGGEPLALPVKYFTDLCDQVKGVLSNSIQSIQTSLIPFRSEWAPLVEKHFDSQIGSSIDFSQRTLKGSSNAYLDLWLSKVELARSYGFLVTPGTVPSVSEVGNGATIVKWFRDNEFHAWNIDRYNSFSGHDENRPTNKQHSAFLTEVFNQVMMDFESGYFAKVNTVQAALLGIVRNMPGDRWGGSCSSDFIVVNPDGSTNACPDKISHEKFSDVSEGFSGYKLSEKRKAWIREQILGHRNSDCPSCPFNTFCKSGCPLTPNTPETEGECSGYSRHLTVVREWAANNWSDAERYLSLCEENQSV
jgi:radical SAM protein with 4Fe4S-binding SPASM domain